MYRGNHSGQLLQSRWCHFSALKRSEGWSVQSPEPAAILPCIRAPDINRELGPITQSMNCQWHIIKSKRASYQCYLGLSLWCKCKHPAGKHSSAAFLITGVCFFYCVSTFLLMDSSQECWHFSKCVFKMLTEQGKGQIAEFCQVRWIKELRRRQMFSENIKESIGLAKRSSWSPRCFRHVC